MRKQALREKIFSNSKIKLKQYLIFLLISIIFFCSTIILKAQYGALNSFSKDNYQFETFNLPGGKLENSVQCIAQDSTGFLWFGTQNGLFKYDGRQFHKYIYNPTDSNSLGSNYIEYIYIDGEILWIATFDNGLTKFNPNTNQYKRYLLKDNKGKDLKKFGINTIIKFQDKLWLGTHNGIHSFDPKKEIQKRYFFKQDSYDIYTSNVFRVLYVDSRDVFWAGKGFTWGKDPENGGLYKYLSDKDEFVEYINDPKNPYTISDNLVKGIFEDSQNNFWIGTMKDGLQLMNREQERFTSFPYPPKQPNQLSRPYVINPIHGDNFYNQVQFIAEDQDNHLWIGGIYSGLNIYNPKTKQQIHFERGLNGLETNFIWNFFESKDHTIFITTGGDGEGKNYKVKVRRNLFSFFSIKEDVIIREIAEDNNQQIWLGGSKGANLWKLDPQKMIIDPIDQFKHTSCYALEFTDKTNQYYIGHPAAKINAFQPDNNTLKPLVTNFLKTSGIPNATIQAIKEDSKGNIWIGSWGQGLSVFNPKTDQIKSFRYNDKEPSGIGGDNISIIYEDVQGNIWVGGGKEAKVLSAPFFLDKVDLKVDTFTHYYESEGEYGFPASISTDQKGNLWYPTTLGGLHQLNTQTGKVTKYNQSNSLIPTDDIRALVIDKNDNIWMSAENNIIRFTKNRTSFITYTSLDGIRDNKFEDGAGYISKNGIIYFGNTGGFHYFNPEIILQNENNDIPEILLSEFNIKNAAHKQKKSFVGSIWKTNEIDLKHNENTFSIGFTCLDYHNPNNVYLEYMLEGYDLTWQKAGIDKTANYNNLPSRDYIFKVRGTNSNGLWNKKGRQLKITIHPPWWKTNWASFLFIITIASLIYKLYQFQLNRQLAIQESKRLAELDATKTRLYTNITHEFRTPLTVILGMNNRLPRYFKDRNSFRHQEAIDTVNRNGEQLLRLINQMLDLSKLESKAMPLDMEQGDIINYIKYLFESFHSYAESKNIRMHFSRDLESLQMDFDRAKIQQIISNLLSNAIKFTEEKGLISLHLSQEKEATFVIKVQDSGIGISKEKLPFIFNRFYQIEKRSLQKGEGSGIGMALTKELVNLLKGSIEVKSILKEGTTFIVRLPISKVAPISKDEKTIQPIVKNEWLSTKIDTPKITIENRESNNSTQLLIVEDNQDVILYLEACLKENYQLIIAQNGQEGIDKAIEFVPDIIISDVMMPMKDGFELCNTLKTDERTSHIPIILLTAKVTVADKIAGLERGADAYLAKPFQPEELEVRLRKLIELRRHLQNRYSANSIPKKKDSSLKLEDEFVLKVQQIIMNNLDNQTFSIDDLCKDIFLSRTQVHRKLTALTGKSTSLFIRSIRLHEAKKMLTTTDKSILAIAFDVGFKEVSYFSRVFVEEFGHTPSFLRK